MWYSHVLTSSKPLMPCQNHFVESHSIWRLILKPIMSLKVIGSQRRITAEDGVKTRTLPEATVLLADFVGKCMHTYAYTYHIYAHIHIFFLSNHSLRQVFCFCFIILNIYVYYKHLINLNFSELIVCTHTHTFCFSKLWCILRPRMVIWAS